MELNYNRFEVDVRSKINQTKKIFAGKQGLLKQIKTSENFCEATHYAANKTLKFYLLLCSFIEKLWLLRAKQQIQNMLLRQ